jgi:CelD/BcsL family acetyltransferase involved in cellulose biosynthesis
VTIHLINPLSDRRWDELVARHPDATVFHRREWLESLTRTYGYKPVVLTTAAPGQALTDGVALCRVASWMTGTRLVSLPFADHCQPLLHDPAGSLEFAAWLGAECDRRKWDYVELRPLLSGGTTDYGLLPERSYCFHELDLTLGSEQLFQRLHKNSFQRKIRRAEREGLSYEAGRSEQLLIEFYRLVVTTRRRQQMLPQPFAWFRNLVQCMGDQVEIRVARKDRTPIAAMLSLRHRANVVFKYGCSDARFHNLGGMPLLFWKLIEESKATGAESLDLGRSDFDNEGLIIFKDRLGTTRRRLTYYRHSLAKSEKPAAAQKSHGFRELLFNLPDAVLATAGGVMYRHWG